MRVISTGTSTTRFLAANRIPAPTPTMAMATAAATRPLVRRAQGLGMRAASLLLHASSTWGSSRSSQVVMRPEAIWASHNSASTSAMLCGRWAGSLLSILKMTSSRSAGISCSGARWRSGSGGSWTWRRRVVTMSSASKGRLPVRAS